MKRIAFFAILLATLIGCSRKAADEAQLHFTKPKAEKGVITFPNDSSASYFLTQAATREDFRVDFTLPARVVATVVESVENPGDQLVLFDNPELTSNYTLLTQHLANINQIENVLIKQRKIELERVLDLQKHGAATGRDILEAQTALALQETNLVNEKAALLEHETFLTLAGFSPRALRKARKNTVWVISEVADNLAGTLIHGERCQLTFPSYPNEVFEGKIDDIGDVVDNVTRLLKLRIIIRNPDGRLKAGMFGTTRFGMLEGVFLSVPLDALVTVQGHTYVFVRQSGHTFVTREVTTGQQDANSIMILEGLSANEEIVVRGAMQLKGLSFGY